MTHDDDIEEDFYASGNARDDEGAEEDWEERPVPELAGLSEMDKLKLARQILLEDLIRAVAAGHATPQEKNTLRQMLKDNGMILGDPFEAQEEGSHGERKAKPKANLPVFAPPEYTQ